MSKKYVEHIEAQRRVDTLKELWEGTSILVWENVTGAIKNSRDIFIVYIILNLFKFFKLFMLSLCINDNAVKT